MLTPAETRILRDAQYALEHGGQSRFIDGANYHRGDLVELLRSKLLAYAWGQGGWHITDVGSRMLAEAQS